MNSSEPTPENAKARHRRRVWRLVLILGISALACQQIWRHGHDYVFAENFAVVEPGKIYRGAWQKPWPMRRIIRDQKIRTIVALAHAPDHPLAKRESALANEMGVRWIHIPIVEDRVGDPSNVFRQLDEAVKVISDPANQPAFFHCHHGVNRASMVHMAYRLKVDHWTLKQASDEIDRLFGLVEASRGPDHRMMERYAQTLDPTTAAR